MKHILLIALIPLVIACGKDKSEAEDYSGFKLPELHKVQTTTLTALYSCGGNYEESALFLSAYSKRFVGPDLLANGNCQGHGYFEAQTAGDDIALISDIGEVPLEMVTANEALNYSRYSGVENPTDFRTNVDIIEGHTYVVLLAKREVRALYLVHVDAYEKGRPLRISYVVKKYQIQETRTASRGWDWEK